MRACLRLSPLSRLQVFAKIMDCKCEIRIKRLNLTHKNKYGRTAINIERQIEIKSYGNLMKRSRSKNAKGVEDTSMRAPSAQWRVPLLELLPINNLIKLPLLYRDI